MKRLAQLTIQAGKRLLKGTPLENSAVVGSIYRAVTRMGYSQSGSIVIFRGLKLQIDPNDISMAPGLRNGTYEQDELTFFTSFLRQGMKVFDVGANIGIYSLLAAQIVGDAGQVHAFEPAPECQKLLFQNMINNHLAKIIVVSKAVSSETGSLEIYVDPSQLGSSSTLVSMLKPSQIRHKVQAVSLDEYCELNKIKPHFTKIDIEGAELNALKGARTLKNSHIMLEYNPVLLKHLDHNPVELTDFIFSHFNRVSIITHGGKLRQIRKHQDLSNSALVNLVVET